jgi:hypothetical protein
MYSGTCFTFGGNLRKANPTEQTISMQTETIKCRHCGLVLHIKPMSGKTNFSYDTEEWKRCCKRIDLGGPGWCLAELDIEQHIKKPKSWR